MVQDGAGGTAAVAAAPGAASPAPAAAAAVAAPAALSVEKHYWGLYVAGEAVARGADRVDVQKYDGAADKSGAPLACCPPPWPLPLSLHHRLFAAAAAAVSPLRLTASPSSFFLPAAACRSPPPPSPRPLNAAAHYSPPPITATGGWLLRYENDNTAGDAFFDAKESRLTFMAEYPAKPTQEDLLWIQT